MPLIVHEDTDPLGSVQHQLTVMLAANKRIDANAVPDQAHRLRMIENDLRQILGEIRGPLVQYRRGSEVLNGMLVEAYGTAETIVVRTSDGVLHERERVSGTIRYREAAGVGVAA